MNYKMSTQNSLPNFYNTKLGRTNTNKSTYDMPTILYTKECMKCYMFAAILLSLLYPNLLGTVHKLLPGCFI